MRTYIKVLKSGGTVECSVMEPEDYEAISVISPSDFVKKLGDVVGEIQLSKDLRIIYIRKMFDALISEGKRINMNRPDISALFDDLIAADSVPGFTEASRVKMGYAPKENGSRTKRKITEIL